MTEKLLDRMRKFLDSEEGRASIEEFFSQKDKEREISDSRSERVNALSDGDFERLMEYVIRKNGVDHIRSCYNKGFQPHPTNLLYLLYYAAEKLGEDMTDKWYMDFNFPVEVYEYRGYFFFSMHGQGVHNRVYKGNEIVIHL